MADKAFQLRRGWRAFTRRLRELRLIAHGALSTSHPIMAHIIPIRRCNLSCTYCNEYDDFSKPVPTEVMIGRINKLADLGTSIGSNCTHGSDAPETAAFEIGYFFAGMELI